MKFVEDERLHALAGDIQLDNLDLCLRALQLQITHQLNDSISESIEGFYRWMEATCTRFSLADDATFCVIHKRDGDDFYSTYVVISPDHLSQLESKIRRILNLKAFL